MFRLRWAASSYGDNRFQWRHRKRDIYIYISTARSSSSVGSSAILHSLEKMLFEILRQSVTQGRRKSRFHTDVSPYVPRTRSITEQVTQLEIDAGTVYMAASISATDPQGAGVGDGTETSVVLNRKHGISLGESPGLGPNGGA